MRVRRTLASSETPTTCSIKRPSVFVFVFCPWAPSEATSEHMAPFPARGRKFPIIACALRQDAYNSRSPLANLAVVRALAVRRRLPCRMGPCHFFCMSTQEHADLPENRSADQGGALTDLATAQRCETWSADSSRSSLVLRANFRDPALTTARHCSDVNEGSPPSRFHGPTTTTPPPLARRVSGAAARSNLTHGSPSWQLDQLSLLVPAQCCDCKSHCFSAQVTR